MPEIRDIVNFAQEKKPIDIMTTFNDLMAQRVAAAVADRRIEVAAKMFNPDMDDETLERIKASAVQQSDDQIDIKDDGNEDAAEDDQDLDDEESNNEDSDEDFELSDEEWAELGIENWDFEDEQDSDTKDEE